MTSKLTVIAASICVFASIAMADWVKQELMTVSYTTNYTDQLTATTQIKGKIEEILLDVPVAGCTTKVTVAYQPLISTMSAVNLATNTITTDLAIRPLKYATDIGGADLEVATGTKVAVPYVLVGETVTFTVTNINATATVSNKTFSCVIKYSNDR